MDKRLELHEKMVSILGSRNVYFQPPATVTLKYPAIVYKLSDINNTFADNEVYRQSYYYTVTVIHSDPDNDVFKLVSRLPGTRFNRHFASENLNHYVFTIYY